jgi:hypothetical protein
VVAAMSTEQVAWWATEFGTLPSTLHALIADDDEAGVLPSGDLADDLGRRASDAMRRYLHASQARP